MIYQKEGHLFVNIIRYLHRKTDASVLYGYKTVQQALQYMRSHGFAEMPVVNQEGQYMGTVKEGDFLWYLVDYGGYEQVKDDKVSRVIRKGMVPALKITATDEELHKAALRSAGIPIVDSRDAFVGVLDREDVIRYFAQQEKQATTVGIA